MSRCGEASLARIGDGVAQVVVQRCKCATCEDCAPGYRRRVSRIAASGNPHLLLTFTAPPRPGVEPAQQAADMIEAITAFRRRWNAQRPKQRIEWMWVIERHQSGWPHLHVLATNSFLPIKLLRVWMFRRMRSRMTNVQPIKSARGAALYVAKYLGKCPAKFGGIARWARSRAYGVKLDWKEPFPELAGVRWERLDEHAHAVLHRMIGQGWRIDPAIKWCHLLRPEPWALPP